MKALGQISVDFYSFYYFTLEGGIDRTFMGHYSKWELVFPSYVVHACIKSHNREMKNVLK